VNADTEPQIRLGQAEISVRAMLLTVMLAA
jgi:hypothetical protein